MRKQSAPMNLRDREIKETLDEDLKYYRQVLEREFQQARLMNETYAPPNRQEKQVAFNINNNFTKFQQQADMVTNRMASRDGKRIDLSGLFASYQELVNYLEVFAGYGSLNQRDLAVIENKFDAVAPQIDQIATQAVAQQLPQASTAIQLSNLLQNRHYILLRDNKPTPIAVPSARPSARQRVPSNIGDTDSDSPAPVPFGQIMRAQSQLERARSIPAGAIKREPRDTGIYTTPTRYVAPPYAEPDYAEMMFAPPQEESGAETTLPTGAPSRAKAPITTIPKTRGDAQLYLKDIPQAEVIALADELGITPAVQERRSKQKSKQRGFKSLLMLAEVRKIFQLREGGDVVRSAQAEAQADPTPLIEYGDQAQADQFIPEEQLQGEGRRRQLGIMCGAGESEDMMYGRPAGMKKALLLRPMDKRPVHFKTADQRGEAGLSLENRMMFLNQLGNKQIKDELEINSTSSYKKAMAEKAKKMAKMKGKE